MNMNILIALKGIGAVLAGLIVVVVLSSATDALMHGTNVFPAAGLPMSDAQWGLAIAYRLFYTVLGAMACASLAPARPMVHVVVMGIIGTCIGSLAAVVTWNLGPEFGPKWFQVMLAVTALPSCWLGAKWLMLLRNPKAARLQ